MIISFLMLMIILIYFDINIKIYGDGWRESAFIGFWVAVLVEMFTWALIFIPLQ